MHRSQFFVYSKPFFKNEIVFFKRKGEPIFYTKASDLKQQTVGVTKNSGPHELLKTMLFEKLDIVMTADVNIKKLMAKRFDLFADEKFGVLYIINTQFPKWRGALECLEPPLQINELHIMISKKVVNNKTIIDAFNKGLQEMIQDGSFNGLLKKYGFSNE